MLDKDDMKQLHHCDEELFRLHRIGPLRIQNASKRAVKKGATCREAAILARIQAVKSKLGVDGAVAKAIVEGVLAINSTSGTA